MSLSEEKQRNIEGISQVKKMDNSKIYVLYKERSFLNETKNVQKNT